MKQLSKALICLVAIFAMQFQASAQTTAYSITDNQLAIPQQLYRINVLNGASVQLTDPVTGLGTNTEYEGLAASGSSLFGVSEFDPALSPAENNVALISVTAPITRTVIGPGHGITFGTESGAAYNWQNGFVYSIASDDLLPSGGVRTQLYRINQNTGLATFLCDVVDPENPANPFPYLDGLAANAVGTGFATAHRAAVTNGLYSFGTLPTNPVAGGQCNVTLIDSNGNGFGDSPNVGNRDTGLAFDYAGNRLFLLLESGEIYQIPAASFATGGTGDVINVAPQPAINVGGTRVAGDFEGFEICRFVPCR